MSNDELMTRQPALQRLPPAVRINANWKEQKTTDYADETDAKGFLWHELCQTSVSDAKSRWIGDPQADGGYDQRVGDNAFHLAISQKIENGRLATASAFCSGQPLPGTPRRVKRFPRRPQSQDGCATRASNSGTGGLKMRQPALE